MRRALLVLAIPVLATGAGLLAGCGGDDSGTTTVTQSVTETTAAPTNPGGETTAPLPPVTTENPPSKKNTVPNLVGQTVAEAQTALAAISLAGRAENQSGGSRTDIKTDWVVCQTIPRAGAKLPVGSPITLLAAESC